MRLQVILLILCGGALGYATASEDRKGKVREKRQWYPGDYNPNPYEDFYPRTQWDNNYANYAPVGGRSGYPPSAGFGNHYEYFGQMHEFYNNLPDARDHGSRSNSFPIPLLTYLHRNSYLPPMKQSDTATLQRSWQQHFQQLGMMPGNGGNFGGFPQPNQPFGQGPGSSLGSYPGLPFGGNSGNNHNGNFGNNAGSSGSGVSSGSNSFGAGAFSDPFGSSGNNAGSSGTEVSSGSNSFGAGNFSDPFGSSGNSNDQFSMDSSHSSDPF